MTDTLTYLGHATTMIRLNGVTVLTDPILRQQLGPLRRHAKPVDLEGVTPDVVLISHDHRDHLDLPSLRRLPADVPMVVPRGVGKLAAKAGASEVTELSAGERATVAGVEFTATEAAHDGRRDPWHADTDPLGYVLDAGGRRVYFPGDTDLFDGMSELAPLDACLPPISGWGLTLGSGHLDPVSAAESLRRLRPSLAVPIHWGTLYPAGLRRLMPGHRRQPEVEFARRAAEVAPEVEVRILQPGESTSLLSGPDSAKVPE
jgi:L-ascorbate metabolism protein UlaG (beta-lactamase superfamily)